MNFSSHHMSRRMRAVSYTHLESGDEKTLQTWNEYLDHLAVLISNLRMAYDMDIILGGDVGGVLSDYMIPLLSLIHIYPAILCIVLVQDEIFLPGKRRHLFQDVF